MNKTYSTVDELMEKAYESINKPFREIDKNGRLINNPKGGIGQLIEEGHFEYKINSDSEPDFKELGIECKTTAFLRTKVSKKYSQGIKAKERLVLNIINYCSENLYSFESSHFWSKNEKILMMFYEYNKNIPKELWYIDNFILFEYPLEDLEIIKNDFDIITKKIKSGKAHEISEADTMYLSASTKGSTAEKSYVKQPYSDILAKQRAFSFKPSYMSYILNNYVYNKDKPSKGSYSIIESPSELKNVSLEELTLLLFKPFIGQTIGSISSKLNYNLKSKSKRYLDSISKRILKAKNDNDDIIEFVKADIQIKSVKLECNSNLKESISFPAICFNDLLSENDWEKSTLYSLIGQQKFLFVIYKEYNNEIYLENVFFWNMPAGDLDIAEIVWEDTKKKIVDGIELTKTSRGISNNFTKASDKMIIHVRPHAGKAFYRTAKFNIGENKKDGDTLPNGDIITKQSFWFNQDYIKKIISNHEKHQL